LFTDGRLRENYFGNSNPVKWSITRTSSKLIIDMATSGCSVLAKLTKHITSRRLGPGPDEDGH
jgi:hypothetical protein